MYYKKILDALPQLIYVTKEDGASGEFFNKTWYEYTGLTEKEALSSWESIVDPHDVEKLSKVISNAVEKKKPYEVEFRLCCKDTGEFRWFLAKASPILNDSGHVTNYVGVSSDIDDIKRSIRNMEDVYEIETEKRLARIKELEEELEVHNTK